MTDDYASRRAEAKAKTKSLRDFLDTLDEQTRQPGEKPLREAVAEQARERLTEMGASSNRNAPLPDRSTAGKAGSPSATERHHSHNDDGSQP